MSKRMVLECDNCGEVKTHHAYEFRAVFPREDGTLFSPGDAIFCSLKCLAKGYFGVEVPDDDES